MARDGFPDGVILRVSVRPADWRNGIFCILLASSFPLTATYAAEESDNLTGQLLVATPEMRDPRFVETVIYMVKHSGEGAFGLVINRPLAKGPLEELLKGFGMDTSGVKGEIIIHYGGPVSPRAGFVLHSDDVLIEELLQSCQRHCDDVGPETHRGDGAGKGTTVIFAHHGLRRLGAGPAGRRTEGRVLVRGVRRQRADLWRGRRAKVAASNGQTKNPAVNSARAGFET